MIRSRIRRDGWIDEFTCRMQTTAMNSPLPPPGEGAAAQTRVTRSRPGRREASNSPPAATTVVNSQSGTAIQPVGDRQDACLTFTP